MRIVVVDDVRIHREGMERLLREAGWVGDVTATTPSGAAHAVGEGERPDAVLMDARARGAAAVLRLLLAAAPELLVVATGVGEADEEIVACLEAGYAGYLRRDGGVEELAEVLRAAARGETVCCPRVASALRRRVSELHRQGGRRTAERPVQLTRREEDVGSLLEEGLSNKQIALRLSITVLTVKNHVHNILAKLRVQRRGEAAARLRALRRARGEE